MTMLRLRPSGYLSRPSLPSQYSLSSAAALLEMKPETLRKLIHCGTVKARTVDRGNQIVWSISRNEVARMARKLFRDKPLKIAQILSPENGRPVVLSIDIQVRKALSELNPSYCSSPFALGQWLCVNATGLVIVDWETCGTQWADDICERICQSPDRPMIIGILPEFHDCRDRGWDLLIHRPATSKQIYKAVTSTFTTGVTK